MEETPYETLTLPTEEFSVETLQKQRTDKKTIEYISKYYYDTNKDGQYYFYDVDTDDYVLKPKKSFEDEVLRRIGYKKEIVQHFATNKCIAKAVHEKTTFV